MIKRIFIVFIIILFSIASCNTEDGPDCFTKAGGIITESRPVEEDFNEIIVMEGIELIVRQDSVRSVEVTAGKNFIRNVNISFDRGILTIEDKSGCRLLRNTSIAKVIVSAPDIEMIHSYTQFTVRTDGVLTVPKLTLMSGIYKESPLTTFVMEVNTNELSVQDNVSSIFRISGETQRLNVSFWSANGRFEGENLIAQNAHIFHRSSNDIIIKPLQTLTGRLLSTGDLVLKNIPDHIEVEQLSSGRLIYP